MKQNTWRNVISLAIMCVTLVGLTALHPFVGLVALGLVAFAWWAGS